MSWFSELVSKGIRVSSSDSSSKLPEGLWLKCDSCGQMLYSDSVRESLGVCRHCDHHMYISAKDRLESLFDEGSQEQHFKGLSASDPLGFTDRKRYKDRLSKAKKESGQEDALLVESGTISSIPAVVVAFEYKFMAGSMGCVVGEKFVRAVDLSLQNAWPLICFAASGGARMQEGVFSLMQMTKTACAIGKLKKAGIPYISVMTNPTMGGVSASLAMLGHVNIAEPKALIGFAGPRVIQQTVHQVLPEGFQTSEFLLENGAIDAVVNRKDMRQYLSRLLRVFACANHHKQINKIDHMPCKKELDDNTQSDTQEPYLML